MDWAEDPATEQQIAQLKKLGFAMARPLSLTEAASLIRQYKKRASRPAGYVQTHDPGPGLPGAALPPPPRASPAERSSPDTMAMVAGAPPPAQPIRARRLIPLRGPDPAEQANVEATRARRLEFWLDTFREMKDMRVSSAQVYELRQRHGHRYFKPNSDQVQDILQALDEGMPGWERDCPEVFYQTLELNFPGLLRRPEGL